MKSKAAFGREKRAGAYQQLAMDTLKEEGQRLVDEAVRRAKEAGVEAVEGMAP